MKNLFIVGIVLMIGCGKDPVKKPASATSTNSLQKMMTVPCVTLTSCITGCTSNGDKCEADCYLAYPNGARDQDPQFLSCYWTCRDRRGACGQSWIEIPEADLCKLTVNSAIDTSSCFP